jgi:hypothetical protein
LKIVNNLILFLLLSCLTHIVPVWRISCAAENACSAEEVMNAVNSACTILESEGERGLKKVRGLKFCGDNYVFVNNFQNISLFDHPGIGMEYLFIVTPDKEQTGIIKTNDFINAARQEQRIMDGRTLYTGTGWVHYLWGDNEKNGTGDAFIRGCLMDRDNVYVGAAINTIER